MLIANQDGIYQSTLLLKSKEIIHGFSSKKDGDMMSSGGELTRFLKKLQIKDNQIIMPIQCHSADVKVITDEEKIHAVPCDGFIYKKSSTKRITLGVRAADCCMVLLADTKNRIIGAVHAGWIGTRDKILIDAIDKMIALGAQKQSINIVIGPYIHNCCYTVDSKRALAYQSLLGKSSNAVIKKKNTWSIDIGEANRMLAESIGILSSQIEVSQQCTSCLSEEYFSWRRSGVKPLAEQIGIISI